jgi:hypothetical protein
LKEERRKEDIEGRKERRKERRKEGIASPGRKKGSKILKDPHPPRCDAGKCVMEASSKEV